MQSETEYVKKASAELAALIAALDELESEEIDCELENDIITIEIGDETTFVINSHRAARQIWMAANRSAWHFDWNEEKSAWISPKEGDELWATLRKVLSPHTDAANVEARLVRPSTL